MTLRFTGRWVFLERTNGTILAIAPKFGRSFRSHRAVMTARHEQVVFMRRHRPPLVTTRNPTVRVDRLEDMADSQLLVWDLRNIRLSYNASGSSSLQVEDGVMPDLGMMANADDFPRDEAVVDPSKLRVGRGALAVVELTGAKGCATSIPDNRVISIRRSGNPDADLGLGRGRPSDFVSFMIEREELQFTFHDGRQQRGKVTLGSGADVGFSHLCPGIRDLNPVDLEFTQYYNLLKPVRRSNVLVPVDLRGQTRAAEGGDCDCVAVVDESQRSRRRSVRGSRVVVRNK